MKKIITLLTQIQKAQELDRHYPPLSRHKFDIRKVTPFAGQSFGAVFIPSKEAIAGVSDHRAQHLHQMHWTEYAQVGSKVPQGNCFDCDVNEYTVRLAGKMLGFTDPTSFVYGRGLSENLALLLTGFHDIMRDGKPRKLAYLAGEFTSDQQVFKSVIKNKRDTLEKAGVPVLHENEYLHTFQPDKNSLYSEDKIIEYVQENAASLSTVVLSEIVFNTGQRLDIQYIMDNLRETLTKHNIIIGLDLAHIVGNRPTALESYNVHFAVGCGYKFLSQDAGTPFGWYIRPDITGKEFHGLQGWKAIQSGAAFQNINKLSPQETLHQNGARLARISNPPPQSIIGTQMIVEELVEHIGLEKYVEQSERLVTFLLHGLKETLGTRLNLITPEDPNHRGATLCFTIEGVDMQKLEHYLLQECKIEVDTRPPVMRLMPHALYNTHEDIARVLEGIQGFMQR